MARITVEDCLDKVANRFELVLLAAHRARGITKGSASTVSWRTTSDCPARDRGAYSVRPGSA